MSWRLSCVWPLRFTGISKAPYRWVEPPRQPGWIGLHPLVDGNKRAAFMAVGVFLAMNGHRLTATPVDAIEAILALAAGSMDEARSADWIRTHLRATA